MKRRIVSLWLAFAVATTAWAQSSKHYDVNGDGSVTVADVTALVNVILGRVEPSDAAAYSNYDVNGDGSVTVADVTTLVNVILGRVEPSDAAVYSNYDVNGDGSVTVADVTALVNVILGRVERSDTEITLTDYVTTGGTISIDDGGIGSTRNGAYAIYRVTVPETGVYDAYALFGSKYDGSSLAVDMDVDASVLAGRPTEAQLTLAASSTGSWTPSERYTFGPFLLKAGHEYYLRLNFLQQESGRWVGNVSQLGLHWSSNQTAKEAVPVDVTTDDGYTLYALDGDNRETIYPFWRGWAWSPNYIEVRNQYIEYYYNQAALDADNRRMRRGCELTCPFKATSEGWYGFQIYLPEGQFPKDVDGSIICQLFNNGERNSWAGHLALNGNRMDLSYRHALVDPNVRTVGTVEWDRWTKVVLYFRVGRNNKGCIRVWMGDEPDEGHPALTADNINFGFGDWIDDTHLNGEVTATNEEADFIGCKFGLYVSSGGDRTIRFDNIKALEGNPDGAFSIVCP